MFHAQDNALQLIRALHLPLQRLRSVDAELADQARRAASSVALNVAEGNRRSGKDRTRIFRIAAGSAAELEAALLIARSWRYLTDEEIAESRALVDRQLRLLWGLTRRG